MQLGGTMKDKITGFIGVAYAHAVYMSGCNQTLLVPSIDEKGGYRDSQWFDDQRLERIGTETVALDNSKSQGGERQAPKR